MADEHTPAPRFDDESTQTNPSADETPPLESNSPKTEPSVQAGDFPRDEENVQEIPSSENDAPEYDPFAVSDDPEAHEKTYVTQQAPTPEPEPETSASVTDDEATATETSASTEEALDFSFDETGTQQKPTALHAKPDAPDFSFDEPPTEPKGLSLDPPVDPDSTEPLEVVNVPEDEEANWQDEQAGTLENEEYNDSALDIHDMPTLSMQGGQSQDVMATLAGTGGLDPNPDVKPSAQAYDFDMNDFDFDENNQTMPHVVPFEHTMVHVPGENVYPPNEQTYYQPQPPQQPQQRPPSGYTQPTMPQNPQQGNYYPPPPPQQPVYPQGGMPPQQYGNKPPQRPKARKKKGFLGCSPGCLMLFGGLFLTFCGGLTLITLLLTATLGSQLEERLTTQIAQIDNYDNFESTFFYDRTGTLLYEAFSEGRRANVNYGDFPQNLINATIAIEDDTFFTNPGFEVEATLRAFLQYVGAADGGTGGSTITQQLVRNVLFAPEYRAERSPQRKIEEILLAFLLTQRRSKEDILTLYLNEIYYGNLAYGAEAAAQTFFDKTVSELTLGEAALLAGLPQAPANYDPFSQDPSIQAQIEIRWRTVLDRMVVEGFITDAQRNDALREGYTIVEPEAPLRAPHFVFYAQNEMANLLTDLGYSSDAIARGGLRVYTTLDLGIYDLASSAANSQIAGLSANNVSNAAVIVTHPVTGEILTMLGSVDYDNETIDGRVNVTTALRQPGSTMKPFTYAGLLEMGYTMGNIIWDTETVLGDYSPVNYDRAFHGPVRMRSALANSYNIPAVQALRMIGVPRLLEIMQRFGVESLGTDASRFGLSLTLGGGEVSLLELTSAYAVFANAGQRVDTTAILCIVDNQDNILYQHGSCPRGTLNEFSRVAVPSGIQVLDPRIAYIISDVLGDNDARSSAMGFNSPLNTGSIASSVKTGTTDDFRDNWTIGYTQNVAVGVWVGNSSGAPMVNSTGLTGAAPIWNAIMTGIYNNPNLLEQFAYNGQLLSDRMAQPQGLSLRSICALNALREPALDCGASTQDWFLDSPAGIADGTGGMQFPPATPPPQIQQPASGPWYYEVEPSVYRALVVPVPPDIAGQIIVNVGPGQPSPPPPLYCLVPIEILGSTPGAQEQLFIAPPPDPNDAVRAEIYARNNGYAFLPNIACSAELASMGGNSGGMVTAFISSPTEGQVVAGGSAIIGTASFAPGSNAQYYKIELYGGEVGERWATLGDVVYSPVVNGQLGTLPLLQPGNYQLQLVVVGMDGNYVQEPYRVSFTVP